MEDYPYIPVVPESLIVLRRMGLKAEAPQYSLNREIDGFLRYAQSQFSVAGRAGEFSLDRIDECHIKIGDTEIESAQLSKLLLKSGKAYIMCAAIPKREADIISETLRKGEGLKALTMDAYASELADRALDYIMKSKNLMLKRTGRMLTPKRFSAGYGDLDIKYQKILYDMIGMRDLGVQINEKFLLTPEKSVIAVAGVQ